MVEALEASGKKGSIVMIDGSPLFISKLLNQVVPDKSEGLSSRIEDLVLSTSVRVLAPDEFKTFSKRILEHATWESKLALAIDVIKTKSIYSVEYGSKMLAALIGRIKMGLEADKMTSKIRQSKLSLVKATELSVKSLKEDYGLGQFSSTKIDISSVEGNHSSILRNPDLIKLLN